MVAELESRPDFFGRKTRAHRYARRYRFCERYYIGTDAVLLERKELSGAPHARLHFVDGKQYPARLAERVRIDHKVVGERTHAAFALYRFEEHRADVGRELALEILEVVVLERLKSARKRRVYVVLSAVVRGGKRRERPAVERALGREDRFFFAAVAEETAYQLERAFIGFRARVGEEYPLKARRIRELFYISRLYLGVVVVGHVHKLVYLLAHRFGIYGMIVAEDIGRDARDEVDVSIAVDVEQAVALAALDTKIVARKYGHVVFGFRFLYFGEIHDVSLYI